MIERTLTAALAPRELEISDDSHRHKGHAGARSGAGHFSLWIVAEAFSGKSLLQRHRMVYDALSEALGTEIHALSIKALTPDEAHTNT